MNDKVFVDTNVLVYSRDSSEKEKQRMAIQWLGRLWQSRTGRLSTQVLHEYYVTVTQKLKPGLRKESARQDIRNLLVWKPIALDTGLLTGAWTIQDRHGLSWWDALIVSAAQASGCQFLLTEDLHDGQILDGLTVVNPFMHAPDS